MDNDAQIELADILKFYMPLAATSVLMMVTHSVISGAVARTLSPAIALAAYSAAYSVGQVFESPCYGMHRMALTFVRGKQSFRTTSRVGAAILAIIATAYILFAWTPLSQVVFQRFLGLSDAVYRQAVPALRVFLVWPIASAVRSIFQSNIVLGKRTYWLTINMGIRVSVMVLVAVVAPRLMPGGPVGSIILMAGLCTESILAFIVAKRFIPPLADDAADVPPARPAHILRFTLPLAFAASIQTLVRPMVTAALSRMAQPEVALAGYQVASSFSYIFVAVTYNIYHVVVIFVKDRASFKRVRAFVLGMGGLASVLLLLASLPQLGSFVFGTVIGAPPEISAEAVRTLSLLALTPIIMACAEFFDGILMLNKHSGLVTAAKICNVAVTSTTVILLSMLWPEIGGAAGALAIASGSAVEAVFSYRSVRVLADTSAYFSQAAKVPSAGA